jgi:hypothetical protein
VSHVVTIKTTLTDRQAIQAACQRLGLAAPVDGEAKMYAGQTVRGFLVRLKDWKYPVAINTTTGEAQHDNFNGYWGHPSELDRFVQAYAACKVTIEARKKGYGVTEAAQADGSIKLTVREN